MPIRPRADGSGNETLAVAQPERTPLPVVVHVIGAPARPERFRLSRGSCILGAGTAADVVIDHDTVSRTHAELTLVPEGVLVRDLNSTNGTHYLGQRVGSITLAPGSRLQLGQVEVAIEPDVYALPAARESAPSSYRGVLGGSPAMRSLFAMLERLEGSLVNVLIQGESGSGKEIVARAIHAGSCIAQAPLVVVNCAALARELVLSELFGHKKGAFTGANESRIGAFEAADGGTLFLDEVGELPLDIQPALLRALESGEVRPVGEAVARTVKVRVIAATNRDLESELGAGRFREDLYYRLAVVKLSVAPLRERPEDIEALALHFASAAGVGSLPREFLDALRQRRWPGNARELRNAVQGFLAIGTLPERASDHDELEAALRRRIDPSRPYAEQKAELQQRFTKVYLEALLAHTGGNQSEAARVSGLDRGYIGKLAARYGIAKPSS